MKGEPALSDESEEIIDIHPVVLGEKRIPKESARAYAAFVEFCAMPQPRSLERFVRYRAEAGVRVHLASVKRWSSWYHWQDRVREYDRSSAKVYRTSACCYILLLNRATKNLNPPLKGLEMLGIV